MREHASDITSGVGKVSGGVANVGVSAFGAVALVFSVIFLTLFGLIDEPRVRDWIGSLMYRDKRERYLDVTDRIIHTTRWRGWVARSCAGPRSPSRTRWLAAEEAQRKAEHEARKELRKAGVEESKADAHAKVETMMEKLHPNKAGASA